MEKRKGDITEEKEQSILRSSYKKTDQIEQEVLEAKKANGEK